MKVWLSVLRIALANIGEMVSMAGHAKCSMSLNESRKKTIYDDYVTRRMETRFRLVSGCNVSAEVMESMHDKPNELIWIWICICIFEARSLLVRVHDPRIFKLIELRCLG